MHSYKMEYLFKVLVVGDIGTGKTSIIKQYIHKMFSDHYASTLGVDFAMKVLHWKDNITIRLQLWDVGGQEKFTAMTRVFYREAVGCIIVYDINKPSTFEAVKRWKKDIDEKVLLSDGSQIPCILLANKCDQLIPEQNIPVLSQLAQFCTDYEFKGSFETSAKTNINIDKSIDFLVEKIIENDKKLTQQSNNSVDIIQPSMYDKPSQVFSNCCS